MGVVMLKVLVQGMIIALWPPIECTGCTKPTAIGLYRVTSGTMRREWLCIMCEKPTKGVAA
jgi:hypothetical protein